jgi:hypothetical protein
MRVNAYAEELTDRIEHVTKSMPMDDHGLGGITFHAVRLYLGFPFLHREDDDDSSAITVWVPWTRAEGHDFDRVISTLRGMARTLEIVRDEVKEHEPVKS